MVKDKEDTPREAMPGMLGGRREEAAVAKCGPAVHDSRFGFSPLRAHRHGIRLVLDHTGN